MLKTTLRSFWEHKRRLISTLIAVALGVAFMAGTFVFTNALNKVFDDLFGTVYAETDAVVQGEEVFDADFGGARERVDEAVLEQVRAVDGVADAQPYVSNSGFSARVLDAEGDAVGSSQGPPTIVESWLPEGPLNPYDLQDGRGPEADDEIALNVAAAEDGEFAVGDEVTLQAAEGDLTYTLVGTFTAGDADSFAGAVSADVTVAEAQRLSGQEGQLTQILVAGADGLAEADLVERLTPIAPEGTEVITGTEAGEEQASDIQQGFSFFSQFLVIFAAIALLVGTFIIYNTFAILVTQRSRELALLRAIGASRGQVLRSVVVEALIVGLVASAVGLGLGVLLAVGVQAALSGAGLDLPSSSVAVSPGIVGYAFAIGVTVTVVAALAPAVRATRVPPIAALRDVAVDHSGRSVPRLVIGLLLVAVAVLNLAQGFGDEGTDALPAVGLGALAAIVGVIVLAPLAATPLSRAVGAFLPRLKGMTGTLARENASRSPKRTAATASALMIAVALVGFINVAAASAQRSLTAVVERGFEADLVVSPTGFATFGFTPAVTQELATVEDVELVTAIQFGETQLEMPDGEMPTNFIGAVDPAAIGSVLDVTMSEGELRDLGDDGIVVDRQIVEDRELAIGDPIGVIAPNGARLDLTLQAVSDDQTLLGSYTITSAAFKATFPEPLDAQVYLNLAEGADPAAVRTEVETVVDRFVGVGVENAEEFAGSLASQVTSFVNVIYGLLALSIIISVIGIANTLSLSIYERTREIGLLRAVGMSRRQVRSTVRWEAVIISLLGTVLGLVLGVALAWPVIASLESVGLSEFVVPAG
ncbi:MAG: FtsX-like permease family protein, partial [Acidimicrobiales bacterium]